MTAQKFIQRRGKTRVEMLVPLSEGAARCQECGARLIALAEQIAHYQGHGYRIEYKTARGAGGLFQTSISAVKR